MGRIVGLLVVVGIAGVIVAGMLTTGTSDDEECDTPVLAAGLLVATSCVETVGYQGRTYFVDCVRVHASRIGERFLTDGGDTYFHGARVIEDIPREDGFVLEGASCPSGEGLAASESFTRLQAGLLTVGRRRRPDREGARASAVGYPGKEGIPRSPEG